VYSALLAQEQGSPKLWNELGVALHQLGRLTDAERSYRKSLDVDPDYALAWNNLGVVCEHRGASAEAEEAFRAAIQRGRALADAWRNLALVLWRAGRKDESLEAYERSLEYDSTSPMAWTGLGVAQMELGRAADAKAALIRAVELDPRFAEARYHLAFALSALGDYQGALRETKLALELDPFIPQPRFRLLIDLQFEDASVLAPELDIPTRVPVGEPIETFDFQPSALDTLFDGAQPPEEEKPAVPALSAAQWIESARRSLLHGQFAKATEESQHAARAGAERKVLPAGRDLFAPRCWRSAERFRGLASSSSRMVEAAIIRCCALRCAVQPSATSS
jgi:tetratricopeptide (TPR) repeat protein